MVALLVFLNPQTEKREGDTMLIPQLAVEIQRLPVEDGGLAVLAPMMGERARLGEGLRPRSRLGATVSPQRLLEPPAPLQEVGAYLPEARQCCGQPEGRMGLVLERPRQRFPQVVVLSLQPNHP